MVDLKSIFKEWLGHFTHAGYKWWKSNHANEAAALAFYSLFSFIPILLIGLFVASMLVGKDTATSSLLEQTNQVTGFSAGDYLTQTLNRDLQWVDNKYSPLVGALVLAFSATKVINELRRALSNIFGNPKYKKKSHAALSILLGRVISFIIIIALGFVIASSVISESIINAIHNQLEDDDSIILAKLISYLSPLATFISVTFLATVIMRWLPKRPPKLKEAIYGAVVCSLLIIGLKYGLMIFLRHANITNMFGGALTLVLILLWIYFAMQAVLYSAEFSANLARERRQLEKKSKKAKATEELESECTTPLPE
ncbi:YihY/virulence factor BrkB family protein [Rubritalea tangerina]|uniref:YihY/virulence factor BrkB family protein n=1 Tax=Rubritalea tangerina TaxID=430798 RepID=A0ABW4ZC04_9BACT